MRWTVEDEINFCTWFDSKGFVLCYMPEISEWGYYHNSNKKVILGGFRELLDLKQHLVDTKGDKKNVRIVSEGDFKRAVEEAGRVRKLH